MENVAFNPGMLTPEGFVASQESELWAERDNSYQKQSRDFFERNLGLKTVEEMKIVIPTLKLLEHYGALDATKVRIELAQEEIRYKAALAMVNMIREECRIAMVVMNSCPNVAMGLKIMMDSVGKARNHKLPNMNVDEHEDVLNVPF